MKSLINIILIAILILSISTKCFAQIDLKKTVFDFAEQYTKDSIVINSRFLLTYNEFKNISISESKKPLDEKTIQTNYKRLNDGIKYNNSELKRNLGKIYSIVSFDSVSYKQKKLSFIDVSIVFRNKRPYFDLNDTTIRTKFVFMLINNKLKFVGPAHVISDLHFNLSKLDRIKTEMENEFHVKYKNIYFNNTSNNCIPFKTNNKWGLVSFDNKIVLNAVYDSIYPFKANYALVKLKGMYNLIDEKFKLVFNEPKKHIIFTENEYLVLNNKNEY
ncbi:WG repeat-containing protein [Sphingobacterium sp. SRCM116780]|uniref:WG repeat-containing protein n=1 Tax=Sphingobacterium sp. SRCM116780 TaxID=2907623 RepID=UPI001F169BDE|nr:WG repeat-containing protein [Sphingobacterium sp. SRCM116780]UIR56644.1 WG repeat-containing protein [Sphingobacterium sp. SRCM116780]